MVLLKNIDDLFIVFFRVLAGEKSAAMRAADTRNDNVRPFRQKSVCFQNGEFGRNFSVRKVHGIVEEIRQFKRRTRNILKHHCIFDLGKVPFQFPNDLRAQLIEIPTIARTKFDYSLLFNQSDDDIFNFFAIRHIIEISMTEKSTGFHKTLL